MIGHRRIDAICLGALALAVGIGMLLTIDQLYSYCMGGKIE